MTQKLILLLSMLLVSVGVEAQQTVSYLYKGKMDGDMDVTLYLREGANPCNGDIYYNGMYKYDKVSEWLLLEIRLDSDDNFIMVESPYTGAMLLKKKLDQLLGTWLSPDGERRLKVQWRQQSFPTDKQREYENIYEEAYYILNDC